MIRFFAKSLIDRAAQRGAALPPWLQRRVDRDPELQRFAAASRGLGGRLRRDAASWMAVPTGDREGAQASPSLERTRGEHSMRRRPSVARTALAFALAASVVAIAAWRALDGATQPPSSPANPSTGDHHVVQISAAQRDQLLAAWRSGQSLAQAWKGRVHSAASRAREIELIDPTLMVPRLNTARAVTRVRTSLDIAVTAPQRELAAGMKSAYDFFARRLGASIAQLVGLQSS